MSKQHNRNFWQQEGGRLLKPKYVENFIATQGRRRTWGGRCKLDKLGVGQMTTPRTCREANKILIECGEDA